MTEPGEIAKVPEQPFNKVLFQTLQTVDSALRKKGNSPLRLTPNGIALENDGQTLVSVTSGDIAVAGQNFQDKLTGTTDGNEAPEISNGFAGFLEEISEGLVRLNHLGVSYFCGNLDEETSRIKNLTQQMQIPLHEETNSEPGQKWLFAGNYDNWENPLLEIVLNEGAPIEGDYWRPHVQIDIDTSLTLEQIKEATNKHLGTDFLKWQLDIPDYGTVLGMGVLGQIGGTKIALGIGTNKRGTEDHRKYELKPVNL